MESPPPSSVVSELEGTLLKDPSPFCYFMLVAFEASGIIRFALLLILWPVVRFLELCGRGDAGLKVAIFVATAGVKVAEIEAVARAVLPKFYFDDVDLEAWGSFCLFRRRVVVSRMPRIMVERFAKEHLQADDVVGSELAVNRFGFATGFVKEDFGVSICRDVSSLFADDDQPCLGMGRPQSSTSFLPLCKEELHPPFMSGKKNGGELIKPLPVIFHDGRLAKRPTPGTALMILVWIPIGILLAAVRIGLGLLLPIWIMPIIAPLLGGEVIVKGKPPLPAVAAGSGSGSGVLFVCTHRTLMDPVVLSAVLQRKIPAVTYSISRLSEILSPIPTLRLTRSRDLDAEMITHELEKGDVVVCPEGTTCREPFLLRFSALFAELTDRIVPVAMNTRVGFFHATTARGWKGMDPIFFFMNPRPVYEVTFLNQLPAEATCSSGKSPYDVANYVQMILAATLGFECTNFTRKDKYRVLAGNDGTVFSGNSAASNGVERLACAFKKVVGTFKPFIIYSLKQVK